jgi:hypothetical protein
MPSMILTCAESFLVCGAYLGHSANCHSFQLAYYIAVVDHPLPTTVPLPKTLWHRVVPELIASPCVVGVVDAVVAEPFDAYDVYWIDLDCAFGTVDSDDDYSCSAHLQRSSVWVPLHFAAGRKTVLQAPFQLTVACAYCEKNLLTNLDDDAAVVA